MNTDPLKNRLDAFSRHFAAASPAVRQPASPARYQRLTDHLGGSLISKRGGSFCKVTTHIPIDHYYSAQTPKGWETVGVFPASAFSAQDRYDELPVESLVYFDTETTGLGGAGAVPFLIGCGSMTLVGFEIRQYLMPDYGDESAMLEAVLREFAAGKTLVTYNGTAFDLPIVRDRLIINRIAADLPAVGHVDLLAPTRRLFKRRLKDCSLTNIERELFGHIRADDLPGYLVPSVYFAWVSDESMDLLPQVLEHNRRDILSLHFLATHLAQTFQTEGQTLSQVDDLYSLSRVYGRRRHHDKVIKLGDRMSQDSETRLPDEILLHQSYALKRSGMLKKAVAIWEEVSVSWSREGYVACLELSKYHEHQTGDLSRALEYALQATRICPYGEPHRRHLQSRIERIKLKLKSE